MSNNAEFRKKPPRFYGDHARQYTLEEVLEEPIDLRESPWDIVSTSPTPLDPYNVKVHGLPYIAMASAEIEGYEYRERPALGSRKEVSDRIIDELMTQHQRSVQKNDEAFRRLREHAATDPRAHTIDHLSAEGLMQVRAGISRLTPIVRLIGRYPDIGAIEMSKATRPYSVERFQAARAYIKDSVQSLASGSDIAVDMEDENPYRYIVDEDLRTIVAKSNLAHLLGPDAGTLLSIRRRDSFTPVDDNYPRPTITGKLGEMTMKLIPIAATAYIRAEGINVGPNPEL